MPDLHNSYLFHLLEQEEEPLSHSCNGSPAKGLVGIARLAAQGEFVRPGHNVQYFTLEARSLLNRCTAPRMPFKWTINPYRGCEFACKYCYARYTHEFMELRDGLDFERKIYIKQQAAWLLRRDLRKVKRGEPIAIGTATDPYQPAERQHRVTRDILEELAQHKGFEIGIVTKSDLILRDRDVLARVAEQNRLYVNLTVTTLDARLARVLEPRAPRPDLRLRRRRGAEPGGNRCRRDLRAGAAGHNRFRGIAGGAGGGDQRGGRKEHLCQSAVSQAMLGGGVFAVSGEGVPCPGRAIPERYASRAFVSETYRREIQSEWRSCGRNTESAMSASRAPRLNRRMPRRPHSCSCSRRREIEASW